MVTCDVIIINKTNETLEGRDLLSPEITVIIAKQTKDSNLLPGSMKIFEKRRMAIRKAKNNIRVNKTEEARKNDI